MAVTNNFVCIVCGEEGKRTGYKQKIHRTCKSEYRRMLNIANAESFVPFVPRTFDEAMQRGRMFYEAGYNRRPVPPNVRYIISRADMASYDLGARHAVEFPRGA